MVENVLARVSKRHPRGNVSSFSLDTLSFYTWKILGTDMRRIRSKEARSRQPPRSHTHTQPTMIRRLFVLIFCALLHTTSAGVTERVYNNALITTHHGLKKQGRVARQVALYTRTAAGEMSRYTRALLAVMGQGIQYGWNHITTAAHRIWNKTMVTSSKIFDMATTYCVSDIKTYMAIDLQDVVTRIDPTVPQTFASKVVEWAWDKTDTPRTTAARVCHMHTTLPSAIYGVSSDFNVTKKQLYKIQYRFMSDIAPLSRAHCSDEFMVQEC